MKNLLPLTLLALGALAAPAAMAQSAIDTDGDGVPDVIEIADGTDPLVKDNAFFSNYNCHECTERTRWVRQAYRDFLGREASSDELAARLRRSTNYIPWDFTFSLSTLGYADGRALVLLYRSAFDREPDAEGFQFHARSRGMGVTVAAIADSFVASPEFVARFGTLGDLGFVQALYEKVLGRAGSAPEWQYHLDRLANGATRGDVLLAFATSGEFAPNLAAPDLFVTYAYLSMLKRLPDPDGYALFTRFMDAWCNGDDGETCIPEDAAWPHVLRAIHNSDEYQHRFVP